MTEDEIETGGSEFSSGQTDESSDSLPDGDEESSDSESGEESSGSEEESETDSTGDSSESGEDETTGSEEESETDSTGDSSESGENETTGSEEESETSTDDSETTGSDDEGEIPNDLPEPNGHCPEFQPGNLTFNAASGARDVQVWVGDAANSLDGPLVFYWHGTGAQPSQAEAVLGKTTIQEIVDMGGIVAAPSSSGNSGIWPWHLVIGTSEDDLEVADEVVACAREKVGIHEGRIHSVGFSAGGLHTAQMSFLRSSYVASVVSYSGGVLFSHPESQNPDNRFAAMIVHGGSEDVVAVANFQNSSERYLESVTENSGFGFICDHGGGHTVPSELSEGAWEFLNAHRWETQPSPFEGQLPSVFPDYCELQ